MIDANLKLIKRTFLIPLTMQQVSSSVQCRESIFPGKRLDIQKLIQKSVKFVIGDEMHNNCGCKQLQLAILLLYSEI